MYYIKNLPQELQRKILYYAMVHPTATMINDLINDKDIKEFEINYNIVDHYYYKDSLYNIMKLLDKLKCSDYYNEWE